VNKVFVILVQTASHPGVCIDGRGNRL